ncbi:hypothetical protein Psch_04224 [Pelotomaculum schinkii]|uniref:DUF3006 domain-containing protein n=1 Tax=Pelotomaculum schinkii TaxID=78350 RepID=A0A4Y7R533_9FIRM|nr:MULTISPECIES: DUF3006 domain-containing protein [Pelotomaculum]TEB04095.1 hypothetical protein Psch_04224 [Pelotomaculum schinkii]TEB11882.1 hypothetical protein Psfp_03846 [Pelotomaculum sp. FP]
MLTIDRFEGEYALIKLNKRIFHIPKVLLPKGAKQGDRVRIEITVEEEPREPRKE